GTRKAICFSDMKYKNKSKCPLPVLSLKKVDNGHEDIIIQLKGKFTNMTLKNNATYRLYERYVDFNTDKVLKVLEKIDGEQENSLFLNILKDPKEFSLSGKRQHPKELNDILEQCDKFSMSQSQKKIAQELLKKRLQIVWGPPGSGKTHFLALFVTWYLTSVISRETNFIIGITACTNDAIDNLLHRISYLLESHKKESDFSCCRVGELEEPKNDKPNRVVLGGTVWDWYKKIREKYRCDIMIIDEGSQLLASDACVVMEVLDPDDGKLIIAGDHMQLGPIIHNAYPIFQDKHPLIFGSIQQCLMRKEDGTSFNGDFFLNEKGSERDYGPYTLQLNDNWRMNKELNSFFQEIYGDNYESKDTNLKLDFDLSKIKDQEIEKIFRSKAAITLVKLILNNHENSGLVEADVVAKIVSVYFDAIQPPKNCNDKPSLIVVTPQHSQRRAIQSKVKNYLENSEFNLKIGTVDKMQGQQADLVIACFGFHDVNEITRKSSFLFDPNRWNVAISRIEILSKKKTSEGLAYISKLEAWAQEKEKREKNSAIIELKMD
ncbi:39004_t:CDS:2, partial [Gigaspora margarita]